MRIAVENVSKTFAHKGNPIEVLHDVSLTVEQGQCLAVNGRFMLASGAVFILFMNKLRAGWHRRHGARGYAPLTHEDMPVDPAGIEKLN